MAYFCSNQTVPKNVAWKILCYELYGENQLHTAKTTEVASNAFKASVFASNTVATIKYGLILPLKKGTVGLTDDEKVYLEVYKDHTALGSKIQKVQKAYKSCIAAQEASDKAASSTSKFESFNARKHASAAGEDLVKKYDKLINLAIRQAEKMGFNETAYKAGVQGKLEEETSGLIYNTVNMIRSQKNIESFLLEPKNFYLKDKEFNFRENLRAHYLSDVKNFVLNVSGLDGNPTNTIDAFIQGLAAIPELGELDDGLVLIEFYDELTNQQGRLAETQDETIQYFKEQIETLMNKPEEITTADLQKIQYQGVSLTSVLKSVNAKQLNKLKESGINLQEVQSQISKIQAEIRETQGFIAKSSDYSFTDVQEFLNDSTVGVANLEGIPKDDTALGRLAKSYTDAFERHTVLTTQIKDITENQAKAKSARNEEIVENQDELAKTNQELERLEGALTKQTSELQAKQTELNEFRTRIALKMKKLAEEKCSNPLEKDMKDLTMSGFKKESDTAVATRQEEINQLLAYRQAMQLEFGVQSDKSTKLEDIVDNLIEDDISLSEKEDNTLRDLNEELKELQKSKVAELTGEEINELAKHLKVENREASLNSIAERLDGVVKAKARIERLTSSTLPRMQRGVDGLSKQMKNIAPFLTLNDEQAVELNASLFDDEAKDEIAAQLESNLVIAKKVTMAVGWEIVKKDNAKYVKPEHGLNRVSELERKLKKRENLDRDTKDLHQLVYGRKHDLQLDIISSDEESDLISMNEVQKSDSTLVERDNDEFFSMDSSGEFNGQFFSMSSEEETNEQVIGLQPLELDEEEEI